MVSAAAIRGAKKYIKHLVNPNRYIKKMFKDVDRLTKAKNSALINRANMTGVDSPEVVAAELFLIEHQPQYSKTGSPLLRRDQIHGGGKTPIPEKPKTIVRKGEEPIPTVERLRPDQEATLKQRKVTGVESNVGEPLAEPLFTGERTTTPQKPSVSASPHDIPVRYTDVEGRARTAKIRARPKGSEGLTSQKKVEAFSGKKLDPMKTKKIKELRLKKTTNEINKFRKSKGIETTNNVNGTQYNQQTCLMCK